MCHYDNEDTSPTVSLPKKRKCTTTHVFDESSKYSHVNNPLRILQDMICRNCNLIVMTEVNK